jgi:hypothetical protein
MARFAVTGSDDGNGPATHRIAAAIETQIVILLPRTVATVAVLSEDRLYVAGEVHLVRRLRGKGTVSGARRQSGGREQSLPHGLSPS